MNTRTATLILASLMILLPFPALAMRLGVAPLAGSGLSSDESRVARSLLIHNLQMELPKDLVVELRQESGMSPSSVLELLAEAKAQGLDRIVLLSADQLGEKLILQFRVLEVATEQNLFTDSFPVAEVEDLDTAMKRVAMAIAREKPIGEVREVGQVLEQEGLRTQQRSALHKTTLQAGYLWPQDDDYDGAARRFAISLSSGIEDRGFDAGWTLSWRRGPAMLLYSDWLIRPKDFCPFLGGSAGFHWLQRRDTTDDKIRFDDGFHMAARGGLVMFRTYEFQMVLQTEYLITWNDNNDRAWMVTLGIRPD